MSKDSQGNKITDPKSLRRHKKVVDTAIREQDRSSSGRMSGKTSERHDSSFNRWARDAKRHRNRTGG